MIIASGILCEKCHLLYVRDYDLRTDRFTLEHPKSLCLDSGKKFFDKPIEFEEYHEHENV